MKLLALLCIPSALALASCPTSRSTERCVLVATHVGAELSPASANPVHDPVRVVPSHPSPVRCRGLVLNGPSVDAGAPFLPDDPVDDLTAIVRGSAMVDGQPRVVCPTFPTNLAPEEAGIAERPCGAAACPNRQFRADARGLALHLVFYDDPGHRPDQSGQAPSGACYYRLLAMSVSWEGKAP